MELLEEDERDEISFSGVPDPISRYFIQYFKLGEDELFLIFPLKIAIIVS